MWKGPFTEKVDGKQKTTFTHYSPHLDQGFPGSVNAKVMYTSYTRVDESDSIEKVYLEIEYEATIAEDSPVDETVVNLTNHNFFNLTKDQLSIAGTKLKIFSNQTIIHDETTLVPTGEIANHPEVPTDLSFITLGEKSPSIDHAFFVQPEVEFQGLDTRKYREPQPLVHMFHPDTKINVLVSSTEPTFQVYTSDFMNIPQLPGESRDWKPRCSVAVEPARPTNAANTPQWRNWVTLKKGDMYGSKTVYVNWISA